MQDSTELHWGEEIEDNMEGKFLTFMISNQEYGIAIRDVIEIIGIQGIAELPNMPVYIKGVTNLRGRVVPVIDMRLRFGLHEKKYDDLTCILIVNINQTIIGLIVDSLSDVQDIDNNKIIDQLSIHKKAENQFIKGFAQVGDSKTILLETKRLLLKDELQILSKIN